MQQEIDRYVRALGQGTMLLKRIEQEIAQREEDKAKLQVQCESLQQTLREQVVKDYDAEIVLKALQDFRKVFHALAPLEQAEVLRCLVRDVVVYPDKLLLEHL